MNLLFILHESFKTSSEKRHSRRCLSTLTFPPACKAEKLHSDWPNDASPVGSSQTLHDDCQAGIENKGLPQPESPDHCRIELKAESSISSDCRYRLNAPPTTIGFLWERRAFPALQRKLIFCTRPSLPGERHPLCFIPMPRFERRESSPFGRRHVWEMRNHDWRSAWRSAKTRLSWWDDRPMRGRAP